MNSKDFVFGCQHEDWENMPELAERLYKYSRKAMTLALEGKSVKDMSNQEFTDAVIRFWFKEGLDGDDIRWMLKTGLSDSYQQRLRLAYDEEYVELYWDGSYIGE